MLNGLSHSKHPLHIFYVNKLKFFDFFDFYFFLRFYLSFETEKVRESTAGAEADGEGEAGSQLSREPDAGLYPSTLRS